jgi:hypothetical protein
MKALVATTRTQGRRANDYHAAVDGELVWIGLVCATDEADPDGGCGCGRGFGGLASHRATTTAVIAELDMEWTQYVEVIRGSLRDQGWPPTVAEEVAEGLAEIAGWWPVGTVVERRLDEVAVREWPGSSALA